MEGAGQVIHIQCQEVGADSHMIGEMQALPTPYLVQQFAEKGHVLVIHVREQETPVPKGIYAVYGKDRQHNPHRHYKRQK